MSESSDKPEKLAPRKPFQYSLRSLFVITAIVALFLGLVKWQPMIAAAVFFLGYFNVSRLPRCESLFRWDSALPFACC